MTEGGAGMRVLLDERLGAVMRFLQKSLTGRSERREFRSHNEFGTAGSQC